MSSDGVARAGRELFTLAQLGIVELSLTNPALNVTTPTGAQLLSSGDVKFTSGRVTKMFEAIFQSSDVDTRFNGEAGVAPWADSALNVKGFGSITDLSVATANDIELGTLATTQVAAMTAPNLKTLRAQAGEVLGKWGATLELTRELTPVKLGVNGAGKTVMLDRGIYVEDATGGYWTLKSGAPILNSYYAYLEAV